MGKFCYVLVAVVLFTMLFTSVGFAAEVTVGGNLELIFSNVSIDKGFTKETKATFNTTDVDINIKAVIDENTEAFVKLDTDDFKGGKNIVKEDSLLEEIYFTFKNISGLPISAKIGKQETPFGLDKDIGISDPYPHGSSGDSYLNKAYVTDSTSEPVEVFETNHFGEVDNKFAFTFIATPIEGAPKIELSVFQNDRGQDTSEADIEPNDNGLSQSYAVRLTSTRVPGLKAQVSFISMHDKSADTTAGQVPDTKALSAGFDFKLDPIEIYGEAIAGQDLEYVEDYDQNIYHVGVAVKPVKAVTILVQYNTILYKNNNDHVKPTLEKIVFTPKYKLENGVELALEYVREIFDVDAQNVDDLTADVISGRIKYSF